MRDALRKENGTFVVWMADLRFARKRNALY